jgi:mono/diheme cytochrome c family protein
MNVLIRQRLAAPALAAMAMVFLVVGPARVARGDEPAPQGDPRVREMLQNARNKATAAKKAAAAPAAPKAAPAEPSAAPDKPATPAVDATGAPITFAKHIAPLLWKNCAACHRPGEIGPFSLLTFEDASKRADFIAEITASRRMPPWRPEPNFGKFADDRRLSDEQIALLGQWAKSGAPEGDPAELPKPPEFSEGWQLGEPDLVLKMPEPFNVPADGSDVYRCFVVPIPLEKDTMVSGVEFRPGNHSVVHHAIMFLDASGAARKKDADDDSPGFESFGGPGITPTGGLGGWAPGAMPRFLPDGIVKYVKKGSDLVLQIHYHPNGKPSVDQSQVGVHFSKKPTQHIVTGIAVVQPKLEIPAGDAHCQIAAETKPVPADVHVMGITPHMHNLGREMKVVATRPDGEDVPLVWIKDWDFNWQGQYQFKEAVPLPKGSIIKVTAVYDNSDKNPKNPNNPPQAVHWGESTSDEMLLCSVQVFTEKQSDLKVVAAMPGSELGAGLDGGVPGQLATNRQAAARKTPAKAVASPAEHSYEATPRGKKKDVFPEGGVEIPEDKAKMLARFDLDGDGKLTRKEVAKMPSPMQSFVLRHIIKKDGGYSKGK